MDLTRLERLADPQSAPRLWDEERQADAAALRDALRWMREAHRLMDSGDPATWVEDAETQYRLIREYEERNNAARV